MKTAILLISCIALFQVSCENKGCTNICAYNFEADADKDDGSCVVKKPSVTFWSDGNSHGFINISIDSNQNGTFDIGEHFGTLAFGFGSEPACGQYNTVTREFEIGTYNYRATASDDDTQWTGEFMLDGCNCVLVQLQD